MKLNPPCVRIDRFIVRSSSADAFIERILRIDNLVATMPGCMGHGAYVKRRDDGRVEVLTVVE